MGTSASPSPTTSCPSPSASCRPASRKGTLCRSSSKPPPRGNLLTCGSSSLKQQQQQQQRAQRFFFYQLFVLRLETTGLRGAVSSPSASAPRGSWLLWFGVGVWVVVGSAIFLI